MQSPDLVDRAILPWDSEGANGIPVAREDSQLLVVQGDTRSAFRYAVGAYEEGIPVFHLEAGVRTYDLSSPWPEEGYRRAITAIATYHACTTDHNFRNLGREGFVRNRRITGSPIVESVRGRLAKGTDGSILSRPLVTLHRRENRPYFTNILEGIRETYAGATFTLSPVLLTHPNGWAIEDWRRSEGWFSDRRVMAHDPLPAVAFAKSLANAPVVVTDSGGVQEECNALGVPCVVTRDKTDRPESLGKGGAILAGTSREGVAKAIREALAMDRSTIDRTIFGDGTASEKIVSWWAELLA